MKKHLIFYVYVSNDFDTNLAVKMSSLCLKRYIHVFDAIVFVLSVDNVRNLDDIRRGISWIKDICGDREYKVRVTQNSNSDREGKLVLEEIYPLILQGKEEYVFFGHTKGTKNVTEGNKAKTKSCLRWLHSMYWYNFEYIGEMEEKLKSEFGMYGTHFSHYGFRMNSNVQTHNNIYLGTFYWFNPAVIKKRMGDRNWLNAPSGELRYFAENLPLFLDDELLTSHGDVLINGMDFDLYGMGDARWEEYLMGLGEMEECLLDENNMLRIVYGEEWEKNK